MDSVDTAKRSEIMSHVKGRDTKPEILVRSLLHRMGFRFRLQARDLPGKPDIVLPKWKTVVFVNGCFWHRHKGCKHATTPSTHVEYWTKKFKENVKRDRYNRSRLKKEGWRVLTIWECELRDMEKLSAKVRKFFDETKNAA
jgi:DNA mismatch endonuclease (patch repair protein)